MKKFVLLFASAWMVYSLVQTGYFVSDPKWREYLKSNPNSVQDNAGNVFNRGARSAYNQKLIYPAKDSTLFSEFQRIDVLPLVYWLYPANLSNSKAKTTRDLFTNPESRVVYYIGMTDNYKQSLGLLNPDYVAKIVLESDGTILAVLERT